MSAMKDFISEKKQKAIKKKYDAVVNVKDVKCIKSFDELLFKTKELVINIGWLYEGFVDTAEENRILKKHFGVTKRQLVKIKKEEEAEEKLNSSTACPTK